MPREKQDTEFCWVGGKQLATRAPIELSLVVHSGILKRGDQVVVGSRIRAKLVERGAVKTAAAADPTLAVVWWSGVVTGAV